jgi:hypothetical protein
MGRTSFLLFFFFGGGGGGGGEFFFSKVFIFTNFLKIKKKSLLNSILGSNR